eukprot:CAMPEP_0172552920 /NCGR_PEP_ID=MMETSP1067-20121228/47265_1 /TAXON_ID=265564 ORGANISM="Thalassiosira punctigera, Strain Tpunct2005C2" /NCGR_SAMPLE_ID=MMETSP1067 /ASSEMBLY_ACC=CAM_ASM_000444 /LENGTH=340 /DNA_ID=CAMNT_0013340995 /DNA_START=27 /DNA_END=1049 /DNA_ORIENTATION=-
MATSAASSPSRRRRVSSIDGNVDEHPVGIQPISRANRSPSRIGSSEIPRTYSGLYGAGAPPMPDIQIQNGVVENEGDGDGDPILSPPRIKPSVFPSQGHTYHAESNLLPFELSRNRNTDWLAAGGPALLVTYISIILIFLLTFLAFVTEPKLAWATLNVGHSLVSIIYLHWIKGSPADFMDGTQGEMNSMTLWEQIVCKPANHLHDAPSPQSATVQSNLDSPPRNLKESMTYAVKKLRSRDVLVVVPTLLAYGSCHIAKYQSEYVMVNVGVWAVLMLPKMPLMNGVRILGINRTAGIDDGDYLEEEKSFDTGENSSVDMDLSDRKSRKLDEPTIEPKKNR